jgi:hypothetical protein
MTQTPHDSASDDPTPDEDRDDAEVERPAPSERNAPSVDPEAPGAALVDPSVEPAEPNEPG